jgi:hypothetical protein
MIMAISDDEENRQAKLEFIKAFFKDLEDKIAFLDELYSLKRRDEAKVLCSCYIDALAANLYWPEERSNYNFVRILNEYSKEEIISYIHPKMLGDALSRKNGRKWKTINDKILSTLKDSRGRLYNDSEILEILSPLVNSTELDKIKQELWRGTYAAIIYNEVRIPSVHGFGTADGITFDKTTFKGQPAPPIEFPLLYGCLKDIEFRVRNLSLSTEKWFGHDFELEK